MHGQDKKLIQYLVRKPEGKRPLGKYKCIWKDNIKMDFMK
jgi:hypothetical protein